MKIKGENKEFMDELDFKENLILKSIDSNKNCIFTQHLNLYLFYKSNNNFKHIPKTILREHLDAHISEIRNNWMENFTSEQLNKFNKNLKSSDVGKLKKKITQEELEAMEDIYQFFENNPEGSEHMLYIFSFENSKKYINENILKYYMKYSNNELKNINESFNALKPSLRTANKLDKITQNLYPLPLTKEISKENFSYLQYRLNEIKKIFDISDTYLNEEESLEFKQKFFIRIKIIEFLNELELVIPNDFIQIKEIFENYFTHNLIKNKSLIKEEKLNIRKNISTNNNLKLLISSVDAIKQNSLLRELADSNLKINNNIDVSINKVSRKVFLMEFSVSNSFLDKEGLLDKIVNVIKEIDDTNDHLLTKRVEFYTKLSNIFDNYLRKDKIESVLKDMGLEKNYKNKSKI